MKFPKEVTHQHRLQGCADIIQRFSTEVTGLGEKLRVLLVQLPPTLAFATGFEGFFENLREQFDTAIVCEPRHASWFSQDVAQTLATYRIGRVAADPSLIPVADQIGGWAETAYYRLHGSPRTYYSSYDDQALTTWREKVECQASNAADAWIIFDNTARGAAAANAFSFQRIFYAPHGA